VSHFVEAIARLAEFASRADAGPREPHDMRVTITFRKPEHRARFLCELLREIEPTAAHAFYSPYMRSDCLTVYGVDIRIPE
jgi:hypothetical protein